MAKIRGKRDLFSATLGKTSPQKGKAFRKVQHGLIYPTALLPKLLESLLTATHKWIESPKNHAATWFTATISFFIQVCPRAVQRWDVWSFTKTLPFLGVVAIFFSAIRFLVLLLSLCLLCRLAFGPPSEPARRSEKEAVAAETPDLNDVRRSRQWCAGVGRPPILPPFPFENVSRWYRPEYRLSPSFWSLDYLPLEYCQFAWWWLWMWWPVIATCVDGLPLYRSWESRLSAEWLSALDPESDHRLAQRQWCVLELSPLVVPVGADTGANPPATVVGVGLRSIGVTRLSSTLLLGVTWLWQSGTCPPLLQMASREVARGVWQRRRPALMTWQRTPFIGWSTSPPRLWLTDGWYVGAIVCALEADKWVWSRQQRGWMTGLIRSNVSTAPCQSDNGPGVMIA